MTGITFRLATPEDWPTIVALHQAQQAAQGTNYELPYLFGSSIAVALVGVDPADSIRNCIYVEMVGELRVVGCSPQAIAAATSELNGLAYAVKLHGLRWLECFVPRPLKKMIGKPLRRAGFTCVDKELAHFTRDLRGNS